MQNGKDVNVVRIAPSVGLLRIDVRSLWAYRELLGFLIWRDLAVRYKQTLLGALWVFLQPLVTLVIYSLLFGRLLAVPTSGVPYPIYAYAALLPWTYFANGISRTSSSLVSSARIIAKIYFPRLIVPLSTVLAGLVDFGLGMMLSFGLMAFYGNWPGVRVFWLPVFLMLAILTALGFGLWLAALNVRYRDVNYLTPFLLQVWMYVTPVIYGVDLIPNRYRPLLWLNPMTGVVEGFRWALLGRQIMDQPIFGPQFFGGVAVTLLVLVGGLAFFQKTERAFADVI